MSVRRFADREDVMGKWPGSSLYYEVQVVSFDASTQLYTVRYKDGTELELKDADIRSLTHFRVKKRTSGSPSRRSRSRSRSPARVRSPGRVRTPGRVTSPRRARSSGSEQTPGRVQTPGTVKSPQRVRSSGRTTKEAEQPVTAAKDSRKGEYLKVHLTPLKLQDYKIVKRNGDAAVVQTNVEYHREPIRKAFAAEEEEVAAEDKYIKEEKVLRYNPKKANLDKIINEAVVKAKPAKKVVLEFGGAIGVSCMMLSMPLCLYYLLGLVAQEDASLSHFYPHLYFIDLWDMTVFGYFLLWILLQALFYLLPIGKIAQGELLANGKRLTYRINGLHALVLTVAVVTLLLYYKINFMFVYERLHQFAASAAVFSVLLSCFVFVRSYRAPQEELSVAGKSGNFIYSFFMGRELNPHIGNFDLKYFSAVHQGLIGWVFINFTMLLAEMSIWKLYYPSVPMMMVTGFQLLYVSHALWNEEAILPSLDIAYDGFGFMLAFGNLAWVPFTYSLQAVYLVRHPVELSWALAAAIIALNTLGYIMFWANNQKYAFRKNPYSANLSHLKSIPTSAGSRLLISGFWGFVRHPNYLGDLIMAWSWCLPCGFAVVLPYFYGFFLTGLLIHRVSRVEHQCKIKYGPDWEKYCQLVPYRIFPYVY